MQLLRLGEILVRVFADHQRQALFSEGGKREGEPNAENREPTAHDETPQGSRLSAEPAERRPILAQLPNGENRIAKPAPSHRLGAGDPRGTREHQGISCPPLTSMIWPMT
jgi:hypothetical protein